MCYAILFARINPSFCFFIETIYVRNTVYGIMRSMVFMNSFVVDRVGRSGGLAVGWKENIDCTILSYSHNYIDVIFNERNVAAWWLSCFYGYLEHERRRACWEFIRYFTGVSNLPMVYLG